MGGEEKSERERFFRDKVEHTQYAWEDNSREPMTGNGRSSRGIVSARQLVKEKSSFSNIIGKDKQTGAAAAYARGNPARNRTNGQIRGVLKIILAVPRRQVSPIFTLKRIASLIRASHANCYSRLASIGNGAK